MFTCSLLFATICSSRWIPDTLAEPSFLPDRLLQAESVEQASIHQLRRSSPLHQHREADSSGACRVVLPRSCSPTQPALLGQQLFQAISTPGQGQGSRATWKGPGPRQLCWESSIFHEILPARCWLRVLGQEQTPAPCKQRARLSGDTDSLPGADEYECEQDAQGPAQR